MRKHLHFFRATRPQRGLEAAEDGDDTYHWGDNPHDNIGRLNHQLLKVLEATAATMCPQEFACDEIALVVAPWNDVGPGAWDFLKGLIGPDVPAQNQRANGPTVVIFHHHEVKAIVSLRMASKQWMTFCGLGTHSSLRKLGLANMLVTMTRVVCQTLGCMGISGSAVKDAWSAWKKMGAHEKESLPILGNYISTYDHSRKVVALASENNGTKFLIWAAQRDESQKLRGKWETCKKNMMRKLSGLPTCAAEDPAPNPGPAVPLGDRDHDVGEVVENPGSGTQKQDNPDCLDSEDQEGEGGGGGAVESPGRGTQNAENSGSQDHEDQGALDLVGGVMEDEEDEEEEDEEDDEEEDDDEEDEGDEEEEEEDSETEE